MHKRANATHKVMRCCLETTTDIGRNMAHNEIKNTANWVMQGTSGVKRNNF